MIASIIVQDWFQPQDASSPPQSLLLIFWRLSIAENIPLAPLTTFRIGGPARYFTEATTEFEVAAAVDHARKHALRLFVLGGGSNVVIADEGWLGLTLKVGIKGIQQEGDFFHVGAGEDWDTFVAHAVSLGYAGVECLSGIPGTVGGTPIQNVGAYGQEVSETLVSVRALDLSTGEGVDIPNAACKFSYRASRFNTTDVRRFIVLGVSYKLRPGGSAALQYVDLKRHFADHEAPPTLTEVREAVCKIRHSKGMLIVDDDPDCRSAGSFFKNPQVTKDVHAVLLARTEGRTPPMPHWAGAEGHVKLSAAWLIEQAGFKKGYVRGPVGISTKHTLAIINRGGARASDIAALRDEIQRRVYDEFGIHLQPEPVFVGF
jgi:UDP-N-acetylmuramate dehydrogenase